MDDTPCGLRGPYPEGTVCVGPAGFAGPDGPPVTEDPAAARAAGRAEARADGAWDQARLLLVHADAFPGPDAAARLGAWLEDLAALRRPLLPVLVHAGWPAPDLVDGFRSGLFDALPTPVTERDWLNLLVRAERRRELRDQGRRLLADGGATQDALRLQRRRLGREATGHAEELLRAQQGLEEANLRLTDAMAELSLLYRFGRQLGTAGNWDDVLRDILRSLADFVGAGGAALVLRSAPEGGYAPRQTWCWEESSWDKVLVSLHDQVDGAVAESIMAPGVFRLDPRAPGGGDEPRRILAQPLEHQDLRLGYLMLLFATRAQRDHAAARYLPFLQAVQVVLAEEVAGAQMLDRIRDMGAFNARVLETVRSAIWVVDEEGRSVFLNRAAETLLTGRAPGPDARDAFLVRYGRGRRLPPVSQERDLPELLLDGLLRLDDAAGPLPAFLRERPDGSYRGEGQILAAAGEHVPVLVQTSLMPGGGRGRSWLVVVAEDLRETRILEAERLRADRLESLVEMSATLAHEIRNPLMGLSAQAELLAEQLPEDDARTRYLDVITREVGRIDDTITRMLNFVRPYAPRRDAVDTGELLADAVALAQARAAAAGTALELAPEAPAGDALRADGGQLKQVLLNLLINGIDAAGPGGRVRVSAGRRRVTLADAGRGTRQVRDGWICEVRDTGPGIPEADRDRVFRPFFTTKSSGTGLGLSICHKIIAAHGGEIGVDREAGETVLRVVLPAPADDAVRAQREEA